MAPRRAVEDLVSSVKPFGVDVASGVEDAPGVKCLAGRAPARRARSPPVLTQTEVN